jgi:putative flippase GtrA
LIHCLEPELKLDCSLQGFIAILVVSKYIRFCIAGLVTSVFDYTSLQFFLTIGLHASFSKSVSWLLSAFISYLININFAFSSYRARVSTGGSLLYVLSQGVGGIAQVISFSILHQVFAWNLNGSFLAAIVVGSIFNFILASAVLSRIM